MRTNEYPDKRDQTLAERAGFGSQSELLSLLYNCDYFTRDLTGCFVAFLIFLVVISTYVNLSP